MSDVSVLQTQLGEIKEQIDSAKTQLAELTPPDQNSPEIRDAVESALREAAAREAGRVQAQRLK